MNEIGYLQGVSRVVVPVNTCLTIPFHLILTLIIMVMFYMLRKFIKVEKTSNRDTNQHRFGRSDARIFCDG